MIIWILLAALLVWNSVLTYVVVMGVANNWSFNKRNEAEIAKLKLNEIIIATGVLAVFDALGLNKKKIETASPVFAQAAPKEKI